jgi:hypothetical protein
METNNDTFLHTVIYFRSTGLSICRPEVEHFFSSTSLFDQRLFLRYRFEYIHSTCEYHQEWLQIEIRY